MQKRLLIVDDNPTLLRSLKRSLSLHEEWQILTAASPDEALAAVREQRPDVVVLDCDLGDETKDGPWILARLREDPLFGDLPVLFLTGARQSVENRVEGLEAGADDYIVKPADPEVILSRAQAALTRAQRQMRPK